MVFTYQDFELDDYKTVLNIKESKHGRPTWFSAKTYKNYRINDFKKSIKGKIFTEFSNARQIALLSNQIRSRLPR